MINIIGKTSTICRGIEDPERNKISILLKNQSLAKDTKETDSFIILTFGSIKYKLFK